MDIKDLQSEAYATAQAHGFSETKFPDWIANIHSEVTEAWEEYRNKAPLDTNRYSWRLTPDFPYDVTSDGEDRYTVTTRPLGTVAVMNQEQFQILLQANKVPMKPEGVPSEIADIVIRCADVAERCGFDLEAAIIEKMAYNKTRSYRHGGKVT